VFVAGRALLRKGQLQTLDADGIRARAREWRRRIQP